MNQSLRIFLLPTTTQKKFSREYLLVMNNKYKIRKILLNTEDEESRNDKKIQKP